MTREEREEVIAELKYARAMTEFNPMTGEVRFRNDEDKRQAKAFDMAIEVLKQEPCEDCISRQVAIDVFERVIHELGIDDEPYNYGEMALSVKNVPPVTPQLKAGRWVHNKCDKCGASRPLLFDYYCPNCGARMEVKE